MDVLDGKVAIITGGASGIGRALGEALVHRGARVVLADINPATVRETAGALAAPGARTPGATGYAMTKHAVVGLSTSLRCEAAGLGVKVSVVCPGFIDTPMKDATRFVNAVDRDAVLKSLPFKLYPADACARAILRGV